MPATYSSSDIRGRHRVHQYTLNSTPNTTRINSKHSTMTSQPTQVKPPYSRIFDDLQFNRVHLGYRLSYASHVPRT